MASMSASVNDGAEEAVHGDLLRADERRQRLDLQVLALDELAQVRQRRRPAGVLGLLGHNFLMVGPATDAWICGAAARSLRRSRSRRRRLFRWPRMLSVRGQS